MGCCCSKTNREGEERVGEERREEEEGEELRSRAAECYVPYGDYPYLATKKDNTKKNLDEQK